MNNLEYWTQKAWSLIKDKTQDITMPKAVEIISEMDDFKTSLISPDELTDGIRQLFTIERNGIKDRVRAKLADLRKDK